MLIGFIALRFNNINSQKTIFSLYFSPTPLNRTEAMQLMKEGGKWELYIPSELGYGDRGAGGQIPGGAVLVFTLELLKVKGDYVKDEM